MNVIQIAPAYPPDVSGVGDYSALLEAAFRDLGCPISTLVVSGAREAGTSRQGGVVVRADEGSLREALGEAQRVLLHFSGYGYARRGLCRWLVDALARWKSAGNGRRLVTMFHEVSATGPIWRSSFWTALPQRRIAQALGRLTDRAFVSSQGGYDGLHPLAPHLPLEILPIFSTIGEPERVAALTKRSPRAVVFGGAARRAEVYHALTADERRVSAGLQRAGVSEICDLGPSDPLVERIGDCPVRGEGILPAEEICKIIGDSRVGFLHYPGFVFTKSSIAAAYFAHRLLVVNSASCEGLPTGLIPKTHLLTVKAFAEGECDPQRVALAGQAWYRGHDISCTATTLSRALE